MRALLPDHTTRRIARHYPAFRTWEPPARRFRSSYRCMPTVRPVLQKVGERRQQSLQAERPGNSGDFWGEGQAHTSGGGCRTGASTVAGIVYLGLATAHDLSVSLMAKLLDERWLPVGVRHYGHPQNVALPWRLMTPTAAASSRQGPKSR